MWEQDRERLFAPLRIALVWQNTDHGREYRVGVQQVISEHPDRFELVPRRVVRTPVERPHTSLIVKVRSVAADVFLSDAHEPDFLLQHRAYMEQGLGHIAVSYGARGAGALGAPGVSETR